MIDALGRRREWKDALAILLAALCLAAGTALAATPTARCTARVVRDRALVDLQLSDFIDPRLAKLIRLGLAGQIQLELVLYRQRPFWFDDAQERTTRESVVRYDPAEAAFVMGGDLIDDPVQLSLDRIALRPSDGMEADGLYKVEVKVSLRVVTPQSLGKVAAWLAGAEGQRETDVSQTLLRVVAEDLARSATCSCVATR